MNNLIEQYLNEFFKELQHTPGPWWKPQFEMEVMTVPRGDIKVCRIHAVSETDDGSHNSKLIARAPDMLRSLCRTYLTLLVKFQFNDRQNSTVREIRISLDSTLASLRNEISNATGLECQYIQDTFNLYAKHVEINS